MRIMLSAIFSISLASSFASAQAVRIAGGLCNSQGTWLQQALDQSNIIVSAINTIKDDPACGALIKAVENTPNVKEMVQNVPGANTSLGNMFYDLSVLSSYMRPQASGVTIPDVKFRQLVNYLVFRKSFDGLTDVKARGFVEGLDASNKQSINAVSERLASFLANSKVVAKASIATAENILSALPDSKLCFDSKPSEVLAIFSGVVGTVSSLASNGDVDNVGRLIGSLMRFSRDNKYMNAMAVVEKERFRASISCLVESTSENYCGLVDGSETLKFVTKPLITVDAEAPLAEQILSAPQKNKFAFPLVGLNLLVRDAPIVTDWMQRILFGTDPKLELEGQMKVNNWKSVIGNISKDITIKANFRDLQTRYLSSSRGDDYSSKLGQVKQILESVLNNMDISMPGNGGSGGASQQINFYENFKNSNTMAWYLLGVPAPEGFNGIQINWNTVWNEWAANGNLGDTDLLLNRINDNLTLASMEANRKATSLINARMIVDPLNLVTEVLKGPGVTPYAAMVNLRDYNSSLIKKFSDSYKQFENQPKMRMHLKSLRAIIPLLHDTNQSLARILEAVDSIQDLNENASSDARTLASKKVMDIIYDSAQMMFSRDSFFETRMRQVVQYDISDTLFLMQQQQKPMTPQLESLFARGSGLVAALSTSFATEPNTQRLDIAVAMEIQKANLASVESLFAHTLLEQIIEVDCKMLGRPYCNFQRTYGSRLLNPNESTQNLTKEIDIHVRNSTSAYSKFIGGFFKLGSGVTDDDANLQVLRAKLCMQSLGFGMRERFEPLCRGAKLISEYAAGENDPQGLNMDYNQMLNSMRQMKNADGSMQFTAQRNAGVCALRNFMRKNYLHRMYMDYQEAK